VPTANRPHIPGYGVPDDLDGVLPWSWAEERLTGAYRYWVGTTTPAGAPHVRPLWGVWIAERFVFSTGPQNATTRNLRADPRVAISVAHDDDAVMVEGTAAPGLVEGAGAAYTAKYGPEFEVGGDDTPLWVVTPKAAFGFIDDTSGFGRTATRWEF